MGSSDAAFSDTARVLIASRSDWRCDRCGLRADHGQFHHRKPRRMGGSSDPSLGLPSNGLYLHPSCHEFIERKRTAAMQLGFILTDRDDPARTPVMLWSGWALLTDDGLTVPLAEVPAASPHAAQDD